MLGHFFYFNKIKTKRLSNHETIFYSQLNIENITNWEIVHFYPLNELILNLKQVSKKLAQGNKWLKKKYI